MVSELYVYHHRQLVGLRLTPAYDLICTRIYPALDRHLAMAVGPESDPGQIRREHWSQLARDVDVAERLVITLVDEVADKLLAGVDALHDNPGDVNPSVLPMIHTFVHKQVRRTRKLLEA